LEAKPVLGLSARFSNIIIDDLDPIARPTEAKRAIDKPVLKGPYFPADGGSDPRSTDEHRHRQALLAARRLPAHRRHSLSTSASPAWRVIG